MQTHPTLAFLELNEKFYNVSEAEKNRRTQRLDDIHAFAEQLLTLQSFFNQHKKDDRVNLNDYPEMVNAHERVIALNEQLGLGLKIQFPDNLVWENNDSIQATSEGIKAYQDSIATKTQQEFALLQEAFQKAAHALEPTKKVLETFDHHGRAILGRSGR